MADKFITFLDGVNASYGNSTSSYYPSSGETMIPWDGSKYTGVIEAYIEISYNYNASGCTPNDTTAVSVELYDITNTTQLATFTDSTDNYELARSGNIYASLPSGAANLEIRFKKLCGTSVQAYCTRLVIVQQSTATPKTMVMIPIGAYSNVRGDTYGTLSSGFNNFEKHFGWDEDNYATIDNVYFWAVLKSSSSGTTSAKLATPAGANSVGTISTASTSWTSVKSADISGSITDDVDYTTWLKNSGRFYTAYISKAFIIVELSPVTKYQGVQTINSVGHYASATTDTELGQYKSFYYDDWSGVTQTDVYEATMKYTGSITPSYTGLYDDSSKIETLSNSSLTYHRVTSGNTESITDDSELGTSVYIKAGGSGSSYCGVCWIVQTVTGIDADTPSGTNMQLQIGDAWTDMELMKLQIGDSWKDVAAGWINKADSWETIF